MQLMFTGQFSHRFLAFGGFQSHLKFEFRCPPFALNTHLFFLHLLSYYFSFYLARGPVFGDNYKYCLAIISSTTSFGGFKGIILCLPLNSTRTKLLEYLRANSGVPPLFSNHI